MGLQQGFLTLRAPAQIRDLMGVLSDALPSRVIKAINDN